MSITVSSAVGTARPAGTSRRIPVLRGLAVVALLVTAAVHVPVAVQHVHEAPYLGVAFYAFVIVTAGAAGSLLVGDHRAVWLGLLGLDSAAVLIFLLSRAVGLPGAADDRGAWAGQAGLVAVAAELVVVLAALRALRDRRTALT